MMLKTAILLVRLLSGREGLPASLNTYRKWALDDGLEALYELSGQDEETDSAIAAGLHGMEIGHLLLVRSQSNSKMAVRDGHQEVVEAPVEDIVGALRETFAIAGIPFSGGIFLRELVKRTMED